MENTTLTPQPLSDFWLMTIPVVVVLGSAAALLILMAYTTALQDEDSGTVLALFPPGSHPEKIFSAVMDAEGRLVTNTWFDSAWIVNSDEPGFVGRLKQHGAVGAFSPDSFQSIAVAGCAFAIPGDLLQADTSSVKTIADDG